LRQCCVRVFGRSRHTTNGPNPRNFAKNREKKFFIFAWGNNFVPYVPIIKIFYYFSFPLHLRIFGLWLIAIFCLRKQYHFCINWLPPFKCSFLYSNQLSEMYATRETCISITRVLKDRKLQLRLIVWITTLCLDLSQLYYWR